MTATKYIVGHTLKAISQHSITSIKFTYAALFEGALQLKLIIKQGYYVLKYAIMHCGTIHGCKIMLVNIAHSYIIITSSRPLHSKSMQ